LEILRKPAKIKVFAPQGAFYFFLGIGGYLKEGEDSFGFATRLLEHARVAVVPGTPFGEPECVRMSFATDDKSLEEGCRRIVGFLGG
jgi:aspartate aminotransferase